MTSSTVKPLVRYPYVRGELLATAAGLFFELAHQPLDAGFGISADMLSFLNAHAECAHCHARATSIETHMLCGPVSPHGRRRQAPAQFHVRPRLVGAFMRIFMSDRERERAFLRRRRVKNAPGSYAPEAIEVLRKLQEGRCFYCFTRLSGPNGSTPCHKDHFVALCDGGSNEINNIVLACATCNESKGWMNGVEFISERRKALSPSARAGLRRTHAARRKDSIRLTPPTAQPWLDFSRV